MSKQKHERLIKEGKLNEDGSRPPDPEPARGENDGHATPLPVNEVAGLPEYESQSNN